MEEDAVELTNSDTVRRAVCPNCYAEIVGPYCPSCGQQQKNLNKYIWSLAGDLMDDIFRPDSRAARTLFALMLRPGHLTKEYFAGRRMRYVPPIRLYLIVSFLFFFVAPLIGQVSGEMPEQVVINAEQEEGEDWREELRASETEITLPWLTEEENQELTIKFRSQLDKTIDRVEEDLPGLIADYMDLMSAVMFFLLPVFAIFLKIFYIGNGFYYAEHLLLAVHNHCFMFLVFLVSGILDLGLDTMVAPVTSFIDSALNLWVPIYMYISLKHVYGGGHFVTFLKYSLLTVFYFILALTGFIGTAILGIMMV
jgi:hypothetical protein